ncbi:MAG: hypothetical protein IJI53_00290 [Clostridia bacterium]|nr:hypothetical protein [Clostridia bacterium]
MERDVRASALKTEEAAMLPALPRRGMAGGLALRDALQKSAAMAEKQIGKLVNTERLGETPGPSAAAPVSPPAARPASRAALYHALGRGR